MVFFPNCQCHKSQTRIGIAPNSKLNKDRMQKWWMVILTTKLFRPAMMEFYAILTYKFCSTRFCAKVQKLLSMASNHSAREVHDLQLLLFRLLKQELHYITAGCEHSFGCQWNNLRSLLRIVAPHPRKVRTNLLGTLGPETASDSLSGVNCRYINK